MEPYRCTHCGAEMSQADFCSRAEKVACRACGKTVFRWQVIQRRDARKELGAPPTGVRVRAGVMEPNRPYEDRVVYSRRKLFMILIGLWLVLMFGSVIVKAVMQAELLGLVCIVPAAFGLYVLLYELFGKDVLHLYSQKGVYTTGIGPWAKRIEFSLSSETYARNDEHLKGGLINPYTPVREVLVTKGTCEDARFGSALPEDVRDFCCACIARRAAGFPLASAKGAAWRPEIEHPLVFSVLAAAIVFCFAYSFSGRERIVVRDGAVEIIESKLWGKRVAVTKIPIKDITYVELVIRDHSLRFLVKDNRVLKQTGRIGRQVSGYQLGLMESIRCKPGTPFDRTRNTTTFFWGLACFLLCPLALSCGGVVITPPRAGKRASDDDDLPKPDVRGLKKRLAAWKTKKGTTK